MKAMIEWKKYLMVVVSDERDSIINEVNEGKKKDGEKKKKEAVQCYSVSQSNYLDAYNRHHIGDHHIPEITKQLQLQLL